MSINRLHRLILLGAAGVVSVVANDASACAVCFGDPNSNMVQGAKAGVLFLAVVIYGVLFSMAGVAGLWAFKARRIAAAADIEDSPDSSDD